MGSLKSDIGSRVGLKIKVKKRHINATGSDVFTMSEPVFFTYQNLTCLTRAIVDLNPRAEMGND
jgi:hypothetical protein